MIASFVSFLIHDHPAIYHITCRIQKPSLNKLGKKKNQYFVASTTAFVGDERSWYYEVNLLLASIML
jgi:hypothetical protein